jgi:mono/diheme cytochrome c family protein
MPRPPGSKNYSNTQRVKKNLFNFFISYFYHKTNTMSSSVLATIHLISVNIFLLLYIIKTILLFSSPANLDKFTRATKVLEMIISFSFLVTGLWLLFILGAVKMLMIIKFIFVFASIPISVIAFKRRKKMMAVLSLLLIVGAYGMSEAAKKKPFIPSKVEVNGNADDLAKLGIKTYVANCAMCHGKDGKKMYRDATDLSTSAIDQASAELIIREGSSSTLKRGQVKMPAFAGTLTDDEIIAVSVYIQTLRK